MKRTVNLFGVKADLTPTIEQGAAAVHVEARMWGAVVDRRTVPTKDIATVIEAFADVAAHAESLMRGAKA